MAVRFQDVLSSLPAEEQAAIQARFEEIRAAAFDAAVSACVGATYGPPSRWGANRPRGWHLPEPCSPHDAAMHDNGCMDALRRIRLRQNEDADRRQQEATLAAISEHRAGRERPVHSVRAAALARTRDADLPATGSFHA